MKINKKTFVALVAGFIFALDQAVKYLVTQQLDLGDSLPIIEGVFHITYLTNTGMAFGLFKGVNLLFIVISCVVIPIFLVLLKDVKENQRLLQFSYGLLLGGAIGNLFDRLLRGHVVDFLDFRIWPIFNITDSAITVGVLLIIFGYYRAKE